MELQHVERRLVHDERSRIGAVGARASSLVVAGPQGGSGVGGPGTTRIVRTGHRASGAGRTEGADAVVSLLVAHPPAAAGDAAPGRDVVTTEGPRGGVEVSAAEIIAAIAAGRVPRGRHRKPRPGRARSSAGPAAMRRPTLYLAAALGGATGIGLVAPGDPPAQADQPQTATDVVSVADALGLPAAAPTPAVTEAQAVGEFRQLAASRAQRETAETAAAQTQASADQAVLQAQAAAAADAARPRAVAPVPGARLSSGFGYRWGTLHAGIDLAAPMLTPEYAVLDGVVVQAGPASGFGQAVYLQHENGDVTLYGHMEQILVSVGQVVRAGETIALLGNQGQSTGPHLHLEVHVGGIDGERTDPVPWLAERGVTV